MAEADISEIIAQLEGWAATAREQMRLLDAERAKRAELAERYERAVAILKKGAGLAEPDEGSFEVELIESGTVTVIHPRPTRDAVRDVLKAFPGQPLGVQAILRAIQLRGWLDPKIGAPIEAVRYAAKALADSDPNVERVGVSVFRWMEKPAGNGMASFALGAGIGAAAAAIAKGVKG